MASEATWNPSLWEAAGGRLPDGWHLTPFGSLLESPKAIAVGVMYPGEHTEVGAPLVRVGDVQDGGQVAEPQMRIAADVHQEYRRTELRGDELLITLVGKPGACVIVRPGMKGWNVARALAVARLQNPSLRPYLKATLESPVMKSIILGMLNTTVQPTLNLKEIKSLPVPIPDDASIAESIGALAELFSQRIDLLRKANTTLEAIAQALFKSWFIDFDPVRAKAEGREPEGMDAATAALFPAEFEESALGLIPKGWSAGSLADLSMLNAASWTRRRAPAEVTYVDLAGVKSNVFDPPQRYRFADAPSRARRSLRAGDTLVGTVRPGNRSFGFIAEAEPGLTGSTGFAVLSPTTPFVAAFVYLSATRDENIDRLAALADGGAYPAVRPELVHSTPCVVPSEVVLRAFHSVASPLLVSIAANTQRGRTLGELRDTLLPRLISGKLRLPEAEAAVEAVA